MQAYHSQSNVAGIRKETTYDKAAESSSAMRTESRYAAAMESSSGIRKTGSQDTQPAFAADLSAAKEQKPLSQLSSPSRSADLADSTETLRFQLQVLVQILRKIFYYSKGMQLPGTEGVFSSSYGNNLSSIGGANGAGGPQTVLSAFHEESEQLDYSAAGTAVTADGREISFTVNLSLSRSLCQALEERYQMPAEAALCDPLMLTFDGDPSAISDQTFLFDLNGDGEKENITAPSEQSAFLAYDRDGNGVITDGSELFGTKSGDGFSDLAEYDQDGNGWIDEADPIFEKLSVFSVDKDGNQKMISLKDADVGAIFLGRSKADFSVRDSENRTLGVQRSAGVFLRESGGAGLVRQIDLASAKA